MRLTYVIKFFVSGVRSGNASSPWDFFIPHKTARVAMTIAKMTHLGMRQACTLIWRCSTKYPDLCIRSGTGQAPPSYLGVHNPCCQYRAISHPHFLQSRKSSVLNRRYEYIAALLIGAGSHNGKVNGKNAQQRTRHRLYRLHSITLSQYTTYRCRPPLA